MAKHKHHAEGSKPRKRSISLGGVVSAVVGGAAGQVGVASLKYAGMGDTGSAAVVGGVGAIGTMMTNGSMRAFAAGVTAAGAGNLAMSGVNFLVQKAAEEGPPNADLPSTERQRLEAAREQARLAERSAGQPAEPQRALHPWERQQQ